MQARWEQQARDRRREVDGGDDEVGSGSTLLAWAVLLTYPVCARGEREDLTVRADCRWVDAYGARMTQKGSVECEQDNEQRATRCTLRNAVRPGEALAA